MPRALTNDELNSVSFFDNISNSELKLFYRNPTTEERNQFANESIQRKRNKVIIRTAQTRRKFGEKILAGIRDGDFVAKKDGKLVGISSDPESPQYDPEWKRLVVQHAPDIVETLGVFVFDGSVETLDDYDEPGDGDEPEDAEKN